MGPYKVLDLVELGSVGEHLENLVLPHCVQSQILAQLAGSCIVWRRKQLGSGVLPVP